MAPPNKGWWDRSQPAVREVGSTEARLGRSIQSVMEMLGHPSGPSWEVSEPSWESFQEEA